MTIHITTLSNGLRIATDTMMESESVVLGAWVGVGTRHEPWNASGVAHLVEHMMFKGTKKRSAYGISKEIENSGGAMNAHTSREETAYYARVLPENTALGLDIIADMLQNSVFNPKEYVREKQVIIQEIGRDMDSPETQIDDITYRLAFPRQTMGRNILGDAKRIHTMPRDSVIDYVARYYNAANMVIIATGKVDHGNFVALVKKHFGKLPNGRKPPQKKPRITTGAAIVARDIEQLHLILGFEGPSFHARRDIFATQVLSIILGGSSSSRLFQKIREKRGLVYTISSGHTAFADCGMFQIYAGTDPKRVGELIPVVCEELKDVTRNVTPSELARAKAQGRAGILMGQEDVMRRAESLGHHMLAFGRPIAIAETLKNLMAVTREDVQRAAQKLFARKPIFTALGPVDQVEAYEKIARRLKR
jgi:predicted Zn-dependent peptidase